MIGTGKKLKIAIILYGGEDTIATVQKLANILKVSSATINNWQAGRTQPSYEQVVIICKTFDITLEEFQSIGE